MLLYVLEAGGAVEACFGFENRASTAVDPQLLLRTENCVVLLWSKRSPRRMTNLVHPATLYLRTGSPPLNCVFVGRTETLVVD